MGTISENELIDYIARQAKSIDPHRDGWRTVQEIQKELAERGLTFGADGGLRKWLRKAVKAGHIEMTRRWGGRGHAAHYRMAPGNVTSR